MQITASDSEVPHRGAVATMLGKTMKLAREPSDLGFARAERPPRPLGNTWVARIESNWSSAEERRLAIRRIET